MQLSKHYAAIRIALQTISASPLSSWWMIPETVSKFSGGIILKFPEHRPAVGLFLRVKLLVYFEAHKE